MPRLFALCLVLLACRDPRATTTDPPPAPEKCGDGIIQTGEACDGSAAGDETCQSLGFDEGTLLCTPACAYDTTLCVRRCGNGQLDPGEACDGALGVPACTTWGANACTPDCALELRFCVSAPFFTPGSELALAKGGPAVLGDISPAGPGDLVMAVPAFQRVEIFPWAMTRAFEAGSSRKLSFQRSPVRTELADLDQDGAADVLTINDDGSIDLLRNTGSQFALTPLDGPCAGRRFVPGDGAARATVYAAGCELLYRLAGAGVTSSSAPHLTALTAAAEGPYCADPTPALHFPDGGAFSLPAPVSSVGVADFDQDGDVDLAAVTAAGVTLYENTGAGFAPVVTFPAAAAEELRTLDLDRDDRADVFWLDGATLHVRRGAGGFTFTEDTVDAGAGEHLSLAIGDADGDSDLDVALTIKTGADSTVTRVFLNRSH